MPGAEFYHFGRRVGWRLLASGCRRGVDYLLAPASSFRYFEFPFALSCFPEEPVRCLDVGSPRLFSFYVAAKVPASSTLMLNPDVNDISETAKVVSRLKMSNVHLQHGGVDVLEHQHELYDCIWSISVIEHIHGEHSDVDAVRLMYESLREGGRLILTVPVDRRFRVEYRDADYYGTQVDRGDGKYFFQYVYDKHSLWERLIKPLGRDPTVVRWFGERERGRYREYERRWIEQGRDCTVEDPREMAEHYREFATWEEMPGMGVCGLMILKEEYTTRSE